MDAAQPDDEIALVYDGQCPVCTAYSCAVDVAPGSGSLRRIDARAAPGVVAELTEARLDLDEGMVVRFRGQYHHGADALHLMAVHGSRRGFANRVNHLVFRSRRRARLLYPLLRLGRNTLLRLLGRAKIGNLQ